MTTLSLFGKKNTMKRDLSSGTTTMPAPSTSTPWFGFQSQYTVVHNLGYVPQVRVYFQSVAGDTKIYPAGGRRLAGTYPGLPNNSVFCLWEVNETTLTIFLESFNTKTGSRDVWWVIYLDEEQ